MNLDHLRIELEQYLAISIHRTPVTFQVLESKVEKDYERKLIQYQGSEADEIRAYLFIPTNKKIIGSVLVHHQHSGERHLGKSEVAGILGDPFQAFCPALAREGIIALAPDSISFEDRRTNKSGTDEDEDPDNDWLQHYNEMAYRLLQGKSLMKKVIDDSTIAISLLTHLDLAPKNKIGILGHSYGGNTVIFHSPLDERIQYSCSSGAVCSYRTKFKFNTGIELAEVIPGFAEKFDIGDLLKCISPRELLIVSATEDKYSRDARALYEAAKLAFSAKNAAHAISIKEYVGGHPLDEKRFSDIIAWFVEVMNL